MDRVPSGLIVLRYKNAGLRGPCVDASKNQKPQGELRLRLNDSKETNGIVS
jgi:hypothetical protein